MNREIIKQTLILIEELELIEDKIKKLSKTKKKS